MHNSTNNLTVLLLVSCLPVSCASTGLYQVSYDPSGDRSVYESARTVMGSPDMSGGLASNQRIMWKATGSCSGEQCTPQEVEIAFYNGSTGELNLDSRRVQLIYDGVTSSLADDGRLDEPPNYSVPRGEFARVPLSWADFVRLAEAKRVEVIFGVTGTSTIRVPLERREAFQALARDVGR